MFLTLGPKPLCMIMLVHHAGWTIRNCDSTCSTNWFMSSVTLLLNVAVKESPFVKYLGGPFIAVKALSEIPGRVSLLVSEGISGTVSGIAEGSGAS